MLNAYSFVEILKINYLKLLEENFKLILLPILDLESNEQIKIKNDSSYFHYHELKWTRL